MQLATLIIIIITFIIHRFCGEKFCHEWRCIIILPNATFRSLLPPFFRFWFLHKKEAGELSDEKKAFSFFSLLATLQLYY